ncbi:hypothetical protein AMEX_G13062 [Astyanax mexicanus]|uniref:Uncharacterized protein n=1 Tax=Astyanax mexicanus TaxID=7994 RepID=A0A8T2LKX9_ASTMX|nr:hypothetical protein AMEX_G13062 [Astyanax mexicanus]
MLATRDGPVPVRELILEDEGKHHEVTLWREAALEELALSQLTEITHLKIVSTKRQERKFNSTVHTTLKKPEKKNRCGIEVVGVSAGSNTTLLLTEDMEELIVPHNVWSGDTEKLIKHLPFIVNIFYEEGVICSIESPAFAEA